jgi:radical SAM-linked protein
VKQGRLRFLGHLDVMRLIIRALRRAGVALVYSRGFNPKPKLSFGPALSVGVSSEGEYFDLGSHDRLDSPEALRRMNAALPDGIRFVSLARIRRDLPALTDAMRAARYRVHIEGRDDLGAALDAFRARRDVTVNRMKKSGRSHSFVLDDELLGLELLDDDSFRMTLALHGGEASIRPGEVLREIFGEASGGITLVREDLLVDWKGRLVDPMLAASASDG